MGIILPQKVQTKWINSNKDWYLSKGYKFTKYRDSLEVDVEDLPIHSSIKILIKCDDCGIEKMISYNDFNASAKKWENNKYYCIKCNQKHVIEEYDSNNQLVKIYPEIAQYLVNEEDGKKYTINSKVHLQFKCPFCNEIHLKMPKTLINGINSLCPLVSTGVSFNNKFIYSILKQSNLKFQREYSDKNWCFIDIEGYKRKVIYDFFIIFNNRKILIEADGGFHYIESNKTNKNLKTQKYIDSLKDQLAADNGYEIYRIDCYNNGNNTNISSLIYNQLKKYFSDIIDFNKIDYKEALFESRKSDYQKVWDLYDNGVTSRKDIANKIDRSPSYVQSALNMGKELNKINYTTQYEKGEENNKQVLKLWEQGLTVDEISEKIHISNVAIYKYLDRKYQETKDKFYKVNTSIFLYCIEDNIYYTKEYLNEMYGVNKAYGSIYKAIKRNGSYKQKHWEIFPCHTIYKQIHDNANINIVIKGE